jgi:hypothetical protein
MSGSKKGRRTDVATRQLPRYTGRLASAALGVCGAACLGTLVGLTTCGSAGHRKGAPPSADPPPAEPTAYPAATLRQAFQDAAPFFTQVAAASLGPAAAKKAAAEAAEDFETLVPQVPYIGDASCPLPSTLIGSAVSLSCSRALQRNGASPREARDLIAAAGKAALEALPPAAMCAQGQQQFTEQWYAMQRRFAPLSQRRRYAGDWVYSFVEGVPGEFDWGWDFTECGIIKFYAAHDAVDLAPSQCVQDFYLSELQGTGLARTRTLVHGDDLCDFRYRRGREVVVSV